MIPAGSLLAGRTRGKPRASGDDPDMDSQFNLAAA